jgi:hypothetical protein
MTEVLTVRLPPGLLSKVDRRAAQHGRPRSEYVRHLIETDAVKPVKTNPSRFASLHLKGRHAIGRGSNNASVRAALARRAYEKNR